MKGTLNGTALFRAPVPEWDSEAPMVDVAAGRKRRRPPRKDRPAPGRRTIRGDQGYRVGLIVHATAGHKDRKDGPAPGPRRPAGRTGPPDPNQRELLQDPLLGGW